MFIYRCKTTTIDESVKRIWTLLYLVRDAWVMFVFLPPCVYRSTGSRWWQVHMILSREWWSHTHFHLLQVLVLVLVLVSEVRVRMTTGNSTGLWIRNTSTGIRHVNRYHTCFRSMSNLRHKIPYYTEFGSSPK
jgi:hypothetical protein